MSQLTTIVKVQRPIFSTGSANTIFVYNAGRDKQSEQVPEPAVLKAMGDEVKMFFFATWRPSELRWDIGEATRYQDW